MGIERSFTFAFKTPGGPAKVVLGGLFSLLFFTVFFPFAVMGYLMRVLCNALEGRDAKLPDWELGSLFNEGLMPVVIVLIYAAPVMAVVAANQLTLNWIGLEMAIVIPLMLLEVVFGVAAALFIPLALIRFAVTRSLKAAFDLKRILGFMKRNKGQYFTAWGLSLGVGAVVGFVIFIVAVIAFVVAWILSDIVVALAVSGVAMAIAGLFLSFVSNLIPMHLYANAYRSSTPFDDDDDGELRSSMAIPPPLSKQDD